MNTESLFAKLYFVIALVFNNFIDVNAACQYATGCQASCLAGGVRSGCNLPPESCGGFGGKCTTMNVQQGSCGVSGTSCECFCPSGYALASYSNCDFPLDQCSGICVCEKLVSEYLDDCVKTYTAGCPPLEQCVNDVCVPFTPMPTPSPTPTDPTSSADDPIINGFGGQVFKFYGRSEAWYSMLSTDSLQWNQYFYEYDQCSRNIEDRMFVTKTALCLPKVDQKISIDITDYSNKSPGCPQGKPNCLGDGTLSIFIGNMEITTPGLYPLKDGTAGRIVAHNFDSICAQKPMDHFTEVDNEDALEKLKKYTASKTLEENNSVRNGRRRRRLSEESSHDKDHNIAIGMLIDKTKSNKQGVNELERCEEWIQKHSNEKSLFDEPGHWSIIHVETQFLNLRVEYLFVEEDYCHRRHLNTCVEKISPELFDDGQWGGIAGETRYIKCNEDGSPIKTNRYDILSSDNDEDYEVGGPFGTTFAARNTKENLKFSKHSVETVNSYDDDVFVI